MELPSGKSKDIEPKEAVLVSFEGRMADDRSMTNGPLFQKADSWLVIVGDSDVVPALDMVRIMKDASFTIAFDHGFLKMSLQYFVS